VSRQEKPTAAIAVIQSQEDWIKHFVDMHTQMPGSPSPDEIRKYPQVFWKMLRDHDDLHVHFYAGHEHQKSVNVFQRPVDLVVPGRLK
jgi:hypothetical protein